MPAADLAARAPTSLRPRSSSRFALRTLDLRAVGARARSAALVRIGVHQPRLRRSPLDRFRRRALGSVLWALPTRAFARGATGRLGDGRGHKHVPRWQLALGDRPAGTAVRALAWLGPVHARENLIGIRKRMAPAEWAALIAGRSALPPWMAQAVGEAGAEMSKDG